MNNLMPSLDLVSPAYRRIELCRQLCLFSLVVTFVLGGLTLYLDIWRHTYFLSIISGVYFYTYWKNRSLIRPWYFTPFALVCFLNTALFAGTVVMGNSPATQLLFLSNLGVSLSVINPQNKRSYWTSIFITLGYFGLVLYQPFFALPRHPLNDYESISDALYILPLLNLGGIVLFLHYSNVQFQKKLSVILDELHSREVTRNELEKTSKVGMWIVDTEKQLFYCNKQLALNFGYNSEDEVKIDEALARYKETVRLDALRGLGKRLESGQSIEFDLPYQTIDKVKKWGKTTAVAEKKPNGHLILRGFTVDVTEAKILEIETQRKQDQLQQIVSRAPAIFFQVKKDKDQKYHISFVGRNINKFVGLPEKEPTSQPKNFFSRIHEEDLPLFKSSLDDAEKWKNSWAWTGRIRIKDKYLWMKGLAHLRKTNTSEEIWDGIFLDKSKQKKLELQLDEERLKALHTSKMAALGQIAGGIAHEVNNPLAIIDGFSQKILRDVENGHPLKDQHDDLQKILTTSNRIKKTVKGLRNFLRDSTNEPMRLVHLKELISNALAVCAEKFRTKGITLNVDPIPDDLFVLCRTSELGQVVLSILTNSYDAIEDMPPPKWIRLSATFEKGMIHLSITDSGKGIHPSIQSVIFDAYFTTKGQKQAPGLGLTTAQDIVKEHKGALSYNEHSRNTQFILSVPGELASISETS